jgi:hypothetical protein
VPLPSKEVARDRSKARRHSRAASRAHRRPSFEACLSGRDRT